MAGIKIVSVQVVGACREHAKLDNPVPTYKDGREVDDKDICCIECQFFPKKEDIK